VRRSTFLAAALFIWLAAAVSSLAAQGLASVPVQGQFIDGRTGRPVPGLTVSLIHPRLGRSAPAYTDASGRFGWQSIPLQQAPYFLEVYWGRNLIYLQPVTVRGPVFLPPMRI
jgi:hypothetical protein